MWRSNSGWISATLLLASASAHAATLRVRIGHVRDARGHVLLAVCRRAEFLHPHCAWQGTAPAAAGSVVVTIANIPPGTYAAEAYHDADDNNRLDRTLLGLPAEGMGFSNNARMFFGPPGFDAAAFDIPPEGATITFNLKYY